MYDLMRGALMIIGFFMLQKLNMSRVYHYIRGQNMIKLYVLTSMLEIFDKLLCSFGQDAFDSLYWLTRSKPEEIGQLFFSFIVVSVYVIIHSGTYFIHVATLTVAINSAEQALITVLILNNFAEIKSFVFKKFDKQNLFQLACSDITERFQLVLFLSVIVSVALVQAGPNWRELFPTHLFIMTVMVLAEAVADWIKHAFISKFNHIDASVYSDFTRVLRKDILNSHKDKIILDHTYAITRRVGLAQIPLGCVTLRYMSLALSSSHCQIYFASMWLVQRLTIALACFGILLVTKIAIGIGLIFYAGTIHNLDLAEREKDKGAAGKRWERQQSIAQLSNIERYTGKWVSALIIKHYFFLTQSLLTLLKQKKPHPHSLLLQYTKGA